MNSIDKNQNNFGQVAAEARVKELEEENLLLIDQLHVVQAELERLHHEVPSSDQPHFPSSVTLNWVDEQLPEVMAENLRCCAVLEAQKEIYQLEKQHALASKLGGILIEAMSSPASLLAAPSRLLGVWRKEKTQVPPKELGGKGFDKVIAAYRAGGLAAVENLLASASISSTVQANALTAVARSLMQQEPVEAAEMARRAYAIEPRPFRLKWLAFRLHEAGELLEAEAMLDVLPSDIQLSDSEARQASRLRNDAKQARMREAKQKCAYSERRAETERQVVALTRARDELATLAAQRQGEIETLQQARDEQATLAAQRQGELLHLTRDQARLEKEKSVLELRQRELEQFAWARDEQTKQIVQKFQDLVAMLTQRDGVVDDLFKKQSESLIQVRKYLGNAFKNEIANSTKQTQAFIGLQNYYATGELPGLNSERNSWPVSQDFALYMVELVETNNYDLIIEFGSGISTVIVAKALAKTLPRRQDRGATCFVSFDHLDQYYQQTRSRLAQAGLEDAVQLMLAPLQDWQAPNGNSYPYYSCQAKLDALAQKHAKVGLRVLVIVDGPPAATGKHARYPAGPLLLQSFTEAHIDILLDDYVRDDDKEIAQIWQAEMQAAGREYKVIEHKFEKDACLISVSPLKKR